MRSYGKAMTPGQIDTIWRLQHNNVFTLEDGRLTLGKAQHIGRLADTFRRTWNQLARAQQDMRAIETLIKLNPGKAAQMSGDVQAAMNGATGILVGVVANGGLTPKNKQLISAALHDINMAAQRQEQMTGIYQRMVRSKV